MNRVKNINDFQKLKNNGEKIAMLTAYDYSTAKVLDEAEIAVPFKEGALEELAGKVEALLLTIKEKI